jgi:hypothetical protein
MRVNLGITEKGFGLQMKIMIGIENQKRHGIRKVRDKD